MALPLLPDGYAPAPRWLCPCSPMAMPLLPDGLPPVLFPKERCVACFKSEERGNEQPFVVSLVLYDGAVHRPSLQFITYN